jgi:AcrR family transcriptional regulator
LPPADSPFQSPQQRSKARAAKREAVLRAAVQMFNERGFHQTSLDDVAASLGISADDLSLPRQQGSGAARMRDHRPVAIAGGGRGSRRSANGRAQRLIAFLTRYAQVNMDDFGRCVVRTGSEALGPESRAQFQALKRKIDTAMRELIEEGVADGSLAPTDTKLLGFALAGALNWPGRWHDPKGALQPAQIAELVAMLAQGFLPR